MRRILIAVDMQNDFIDGVLGTKEAEAVVERVKEKIRSYPVENMKRNYHISRQIARLSE